MQFSSTLRGIAHMIGAMACFALMNAAVRALSYELPSPQMVFLRSVMSLGIAALFVAARHGPRTASFKTTRFRGHLWRGCLGFAAMEIWFYSISIMPITVATALSFTTPIFVTIFAIVFFGEKAGWRRWAAIVIGFLGVMLILKPGMGSVQLSASFVLLASALMALAAVVVKSLVRSQSPQLIVFYMSVIIAPLSLPLALLDWHHVTVQHLALSYIIALFSVLAQLLLTRAYQLADMVALMPFDFTRLIFVAILGYLFFGEILDAQSWCGAAIIAASTIYIAWREHRLARSIPPAAPIT